MEIKVLGTGCVPVKALFSATEQAVKELNLDAQVVKGKICSKLWSITYCHFRLW